MSNGLVFKPTNEGEGMDLEQAIALSNIASGLPSGAGGLANAASSGELPPMPEIVKQALTDKKEVYDPKTMIMAPASQTSNFSRTNVSPIENKNNMITMRPESIPPSQTRENIALDSPPIIPKTPAGITNVLSNATPKEKEELKAVVAEKKAQGADAREIMGTVLSFLGQGMSGLGAASRAYVGDQGGTAQHLGYFDKVGRERNQRIQTADQRDPNSEISIMARDIAERAGVKVSNNATYEQIKKVLPGMQGVAQQLRAEQARKMSQREGLSPYQQEQLRQSEIGRKRLIDRDTSTQIKDYAKNTSVPFEVLEAIKGIEGVLGSEVGQGVDYPGKQFPLIGGSTRSFSEEGRDFNTRLQKVQNAILKMRSGAAVTESEMKRLQEEFQSGIKTEKDLDRVLGEIKKVFGREMDLQNTALTNEARERLKKEGLYFDYQKPSELSDFVVREMDGVKYKFDPRTKKNLGRYDG